MPLFNIGTEQINREQHQDTIQNWFKVLSEIALPDIQNVTAENDVFQGKGYNAEYIAGHFANTLVLPTEIKKVYCDELTGDSYPKIIRLLQLNLKQAILANANYFC